MTSDLCLVMVLRKVDAIKQWRALMGPTNPDAARAAAEAEHPLDDSQWSLRALFGTAGPKNATHGSDSPFSALREINLFFPSSSHVYERTALFVTAEAAANVGAITAALEGDSFIVAAHATVTLSAAQAKAFAPDAAAALSQGPAVCLVVEGFNAALRLVLRTGPAVSVAKANIPSSLRALFGSSDSAPGVVPAPNALAAAEWIAASFPAPLPLERTLALIKPGVAATYGAVITRELANSGFTILAEARVTMSAEQARTLYAEHAEKPFFDTLVRYMTSDDVIALALEKPAAIRSLQVILGPTSPDVAAREAKHTLRGRFGSTTLANAVHGSSSIAAANREVCARIVYTRQRLRCLFLTFVCVRVYVCVHADLLFLPVAAPNAPVGWCSCCAVFEGRARC